MFAYEEEVQRLPFQYIDSIKSPDGLVLRLNCEMCKVFWVHFHNHFVCSPDLPVQEFRSYLADLPHLLEVKAASCKGLVTECEVCDALKQVSLKKLPGLDGLPYEVYLRMTHIFVPILMDVFNHWFTQSAILDSVTKGEITLLKKGDRYVWEGLDDYRPITLLNTGLKILVQVLANHLQLVISNLIKLEKNYTVKGRSIQDNFHLVHKVPKSC